MNIERFERPLTRARARGRWTREGLVAVVVVAFAAILVVWGGVGVVAIVVLALRGAG